MKSLAFAVIVTVPVFLAGCSGGTTGTGGGAGGGKGGGAGATGKIDTAGKRVFYSISGMVGDFLIISTAANPNDDTGVLDTAVSIYNATGSMLLASGDDAFPRITTDTEFFYRVPATATYCVTIEDWSTWAAETPVAHPNDTYTLNIDKLNTAATSVTFDTEPNDTNVTAQTLNIKPFTTAAGGFTFLAGMLGSGTDLDIYKFTMGNSPDGGAGPTQITVYIPPVGAPPAVSTNTYGSSLERFSVTIKKADGTVMASVVPPTGAVESTSDSISAPLPPGDYLLYIERPAGLAAGSNDFYATTVELLTDNPLEAMEAANNLQTTAEPIPMQQSATDPKARSGFILGHQAAGDVDFYSFPAGANDKLSLACGALRSGSGLIGAKFEVYNSTSATPLQSETESTTQDVYWGSGGTATKPDVSLGADAGTFFFKVSHTSQDATNTGDFYRCGIHLTAP
jgi:hypothetical protein